MVRRSARPPLPLFLSLACCGARVAGSTGRQAVVLAIAGRPKCGTTHLYYVLRTHPNVLALGKEQCVSAGVADFFARELLRGALDFGDRAAWEKACAEQTRESCHRVIEKLPDKHASGTFVVLASCQRVWRTSVLNATKAARTKVLFSIRDPASYLWAHYNFWQHGGDLIYKEGGWADKSGHADHYRSPEHFHELLLARGTLRASDHWGEGRCGCPLCPEQARVCVGLTDIQALVEAFGPESVLPLQQENLDQFATFERICNFVGLDPNLIDVKDVHSATNPKSMGHSSNRANDHTTASLGTYAISNYRTILPESRALIYKALRPVCIEVQDLYQLFFPDCIHPAEPGSGSFPSSALARSPAGVTPSAALALATPPATDPPAEPGVGSGPAAAAAAAPEGPLEGCRDLLGAAALLAGVAGCLLGSWVRGESVSQIEAKLERGKACDGRAEEMKFAPEADGDL